MFKHCFYVNINDWWRVNEHCTIRVIGLWFFFCFSLLASCSSPCIDQHPECMYHSGPGAFLKMAADDSNRRRIAYIDDVAFLEDWLIVKHAFRALWSYDYNRKSIRKVRTLFFCFFHYQSNDTGLMTSRNQPDVFVFELLSRSHNPWSTTTHPAGSSIKMVNCCKVCRFG